jgi:predicted TIM-barrel fold metal-dependent hydrolase
MRTTWQKVQTLGLAIQMHFIPYYAPQIGELARQFPDVPIVLDHLGRAGQGTPTEFAQVLKLANFPEVYMKYSGVEYSSHEKYPYRDVKPIVKAAFDAFGPDRLIWGAVGSSMAEFNQQLELLDTMFDYASEVDRTKIRGGNAIRLFRW